jgi:hypothetical protein
VRAARLVGILATGITFEQQYTEKSKEQGRQNLPTLMGRLGMHREARSGRGGGVWSRGGSELEEARCGGAAVQVYRRQLGEPAADRHRIREALLTRFGVLLAPNPARRLEAPGAGWPLNPSGGDSRVPSASFSSVLAAREE